MVDPKYPRLRNDVLALLFLPLLARLQTTGKLPFQDSVQTSPPQLRMFPSNPSGDTFVQSSCGEYAQSNFETCV